MGKHIHEKRCHPPKYLLKSNSRTIAQYYGNREMEIIIFMNDAGRHAHSRSMLEVPIFWFIYNEPLLLDKHFQAKALSDMIVVVQSEPSSWESHLHCNGHSLLMNLRLDSETYILVFILPCSSCLQTSYYCISYLGNMLMMEPKDSGY